MTLLIPKSVTIHSNCSSDPGGVCEIVSLISRAWPTGGAPGVILEAYELSEDDPVPACPHRASPLRPFLLNLAMLSERKDIRTMGCVYAGGTAGLAVSKGQGDPTGYKRPLRSMADVPEHLAKATLTLLTNDHQHARDVG